MIVARVIASECEKYIQQSKINKDTEDKEAFVIIHMSSFYNLDV